MAWWNIFGTMKMVDAAADTIKTGTSMLDNAFFTEQERAAAMQKFTDTWLGIQDKIASENSLSSITRRILAYMIMGTFLALVVFACLIWKLDPAWSAYVLKVLAETQIGVLAVAVGTTYFVFYEYKKIKNGAKNG